jgi:hypothetical protein
VLRHPSFFREQKREKRESNQPSGQRSDIAGEPWIGRNEIGKQGFKVAGIVHSAISARLLNQICMSEGKRPIVTAVLVP